MGPDRSASPRAVLNHYRLTKRGTKLVRDRARDDISRATSRICNDHLDCPGWIGLAPAVACADSKYRRGRQTNGKRADGSHFSVLPIIVAS